MKPQNIREFRKQNILAREKLLNQIIDFLKKLNPLAIHQFGSGAYGYKDEFSDLDLWFTFPDDQIDEVVKTRFKIYESIAPVLLKHESAKNSPLGGKYTLVIFETEERLFHVDFYLSKKSHAIIRSDAKLLYGDDSLPRGEWVLDSQAKEDDNLEIQVNAIIFMVFIAIKGVVRSWGDENPAFANFIKDIYKHIDKLSGERLKSLPEKLSFPFIYSVFDNIYPLATSKQKEVIHKIRGYAKEVEKLYSN